MILYLIRHGETAHNRDGLGLGRDDVPLTQLGALQARAVAARLQHEPIGRVFTSPLRRAGQVAALLGDHLTLAPEPRPELIELDVGQTEGLPFAEMRVRYPDFLAAWRGPHPEMATMPGGESLLDVDRRLAPFLDEVLTLDVEAVAIVSHNFVLRLLLCRLLGLPPSRFRSLVVDVASLSTVRCASGETTLLSLNDTCHLAALEPTAARA